MRTEKEIRTKYIDYLALYKKMQTHGDNTGIDLRCFNDNICGVLSILEWVLEERKEQ